MPRLPVVLALAPVLAMGCGDGTGPDDDPALPAPPSGLSAAVLSSTSARLSWTDNSTNESGFRIYRGTSASAVALVSTATVNSTSYDDVGLESSTTYYFRVSAFNEDGESEYASASIATPAAPAIRLSDTTLAFFATVGGSTPASRDLYVSNGGGSVLAGLSASIGYDVGDAWLSATLSQPAAPSTLTVAASPGGLGPGVYRATITVAAPEAVNSPQTVRVTLSILAWATLAAGYYHTCGLTADSVAFCWGWNSNGQLGGGCTTDCRTPRVVAGEIAFASLTAGDVHTCGLTGSGAAYCWGSNGSGALGDGTTTERSLPTRVTGQLTFASLTAGDAHTCGVTTTGAAYCWGRNLHGALGDSTMTNRSSPTLVRGQLTLTSLTAGEDHTCGVTTTGAAYCWGKNTSGQLGDGTSGTDRLVPTAVTGGLTFARLTAATSHTCGLTPAGSAYCWGYNGRGQLGDGTGEFRLAPTVVTGGVSFASVTAGDYRSCGITTGGAGYCWGDNLYGGLGDGSTTDRSVPTAVAGGLAFTNLTVGSWAHSCGATTLGVAYCWGRNVYGQLGDGSTLDRTSPTRIADP